MKKKELIIPNVGLAEKFESDFHIRLRKNIQFEDYADQTVQKYGDRNFRLTNAVITFYVGESIDLINLKQELQSKGFNNVRKDKFSGLIYKFNLTKNDITQKFTFLIFNTGAIVTVGLKTILKVNTKYYIEHLNALFKIANCTQTVKEYKISNLVFAFKLPEQKINFYKILKDNNLRKRSEYSREIFPAFFMKPYKDQKLISLLYASGSCILTGFKNETNFKITYDNTNNIIMSAGPNQIQNISSTYALVLEELNKCQAFPEEITKKYKPMPPKNYSKSKL